MPRIPRYHLDILRNGLAQGGLAAAPTAATIATVDTGWAAAD